MNNQTLATIVPPKIVKEIENLVKKGRYRSKSDFVYQAVVKKLEEERVSNED